MHTHLLHIPHFLPILILLIPHFLFLSTRSAIPYSTEILALISGTINIQGFRLVSAATETFLEHRGEKAAAGISDIRSREPHFTGTVYSMNVYVQR